MDAATHERRANFLLHWHLHHDRDRDLRLWLGQRRCLGRPCRIATRVGYKLSRVDRKHRQPFVHPIDVTCGVFATRRRCRKIRLIIQIVKKKSSKFLDCRDRRSAERHVTKSSNESCVTQTRGAPERFTRLPHASRKFGRLHRDTAHFCGYDTPRPKPT